MSWKDFLHFQKGDKIAIVLLLILISIVGGVYIATLYMVKNDVEIANDIPYTDSINATRNKVDSGFHKSEVPTPYYPQKLKHGQTIELNSADTTELKKIPGIGSAYSNRIVKYRNLLGGYTDISQLNEVWGIDEDLYKKIKEYLTVEKKVTRIKINTASFKEINRHPYISYEQTKVIVDIRQRKGKIESIDRLSLLDEFTDNDLKRLSNYLSFD